MSRCRSRFYIYVVFKEFFVDGLQFAYIGELFTTHIRGKGKLHSSRSVCITCL